MSSFYLLIEDSIAGPFSGVELREAAMAGILRYEAIVGGHPKGPWFRAADIGLFSQKRTALPHPPGTMLETYQVRGIQGGDEGIFKLRELIGFSARGLLPTDAMIRTDTSTDWFPVHQIPILRACLDGELVRLSETGSLVFRTDVQSRLDASLQRVDPGHSGGPSPHRSTPDPPSETGLPPGQVAGSAHLRSASAPKPPPIFDAAEAAAADAEMEQERAQRLAEREQQEQHEQGRKGLDARLTISARLRRFYQAMRTPLVGKRSLIPWQKVGTVSLGLLLMGGCVTLAALTLRTRPTTRDDLIGHWIHEADLANGGETKSGSFDERFVMTFRRDGRFVLAATLMELSEKDATDSWGGNFLVEAAPVRSPPLAAVVGTSEWIDYVSPQHWVDEIRFTDGHVRLEGFLTTPPRIAGHAVTDFYVRTDGEDLLVGYASELRWHQDETSLQAGWMRLRRMKIDANIVVADELRRLKPTENLERIPYGGVIEVPHVSEAVVIAPEGMEVKQGDETILRHSCMAYSEEIRFESMIARYGGPDEVRPIRDSDLGSMFAELPENTLKGGRILRYGDLLFAFSDQGVLRYVVAPDISTTRR